MTRWAEDVSPRNAHREYPRPQLVRDDWQNLNGLWDYAITGKDAGRPAAWDGRILVPFPVESALSGVMRRVTETNRVWYRRTFSLPRKWKQHRLMLHFGAVDWEAVVYVNGKELGTHRGGYDGFSFDITDALRPSGEQEIVVAVFDPTNRGKQPLGKQSLNPNSIWYVPTSGIWQTVWIEPVAETHLKSFKVVTDIDQGTVTFDFNKAGANDASVAVTIRDGRRRVAQGSTAGSRLTLRVPKAKLWSTDTPFLYNVKLTVHANGRRVDEVDSYFGMRKIALGRDEYGIVRLFLNNKPLFQYGTLDQGFWPDGLYTAPTDEALRFDIEITKRLGFNMARKHVKVEPARWYYWCDKLGLLVWQDMPSGEAHIRSDEPDIQRTPESAAQFETELRRMIEGFQNHPSIVMWVPFNEGWGQFDTARIAAMVKRLDPTRLVNSVSGWADRGVGDVFDWHNYPGPAAPPREDKRAVVLGEFGGLGLPIKGHTWQDEQNWGYVNYADTDELTSAYLRLLEKLHPLTGERGLAAAVYTQTTDVEGEVNGLLTYDREVVKMDAKVIAEAARKLYSPPVMTRTSVIVPAADSAAAVWRFTTNAPAADWFTTGFSDAGWLQGRSGFGTTNTPGAIVGTTWNTPSIWMRREVNLTASQLRHLQLWLHHDDDVEVYANGKRIFRSNGFMRNYESVPLSPGSRGMFKPGRNVIAVHCRSQMGGQFVDVGLVEVKPVNGN